MKGNVPLEIECKGGAGHFRASALEDIYTINPAAPSDLDLN